jgi:hypothetical protein
MGKDQMDVKAVGKKKMREKHLKDKTQYTK